MIAEVVQHHHGIYIPLWVPALVFCLICFYPGSRAERYVKGKFNGRRSRR